MEDNNFTLSGDINGPLLAAVISIEMIAGLITNSFVLILTLSHIKTWKQPSTIFLTNMLISNLMIVFFVMPFTITTTATGEWLFGKTYKQKMKVCQFTAFMFWFCVIVTTEGFVLLSFDRFFYIVKSFEYERHMNRKISIIIVTLSWLLAALLTSPPLFGLGRFDFSSSYGICVPRWEGEPGYVIYMLIVFVIFLLSIIVTSSWTMFYTRRYLNMERHRLQLLDLNNDASNSDIYASRKRKVIGLFGMIMIVHLLCYLPSMIVALMELIAVQPPQLYATIFILFLLLTVLSPLVQSFFRRDIRASVLKFGGWWSRVAKLFNGRYIRIASSSEN